MNKVLTPSLLLSIGLVCFTLLLIFSGYALGLIPDEDQAALKHRAALANLTALQVAALLDHHDGEGLQVALGGLVGGGRDVSWVSVSDPRGKLIARAGPLPARGERSPSRAQVHIRIPAPGGVEDDVVIAFRPLPREANVFGLTNSMNELMGFIALAGFAGYYLLLRRGLRELDPSKTVPERVKTAFDTLAEGVLITDERGYILLANAAFARGIGTTESALIGMDVSALPWMPARDSPADEPWPWMAAMKDRVSITGVPMSIENRSQVMLRFIVNATCINGAKSELRGAIITFDDVTVLHQTNEELNNSLEQLRIMQATIEKKNEQLKVLASTDPLTNCLNRRTLFARLDEEASRARPGGLRISILMVDGDRFKSINDRFGHAVGDRVLIGLVEVMRQTVSEQDLVGRYGGEEFCVALIGRSQVEAEDLAERIRSAVAEDHGWLPNAERVTVSIGLAATSDDGQPPIADLVHRADEALYAAKSGGRNRVMSWTRLHPLAHSLAS